MASSSDSNAQKPVRKFELLDIHPLELAQQLALMEHDLCRNVQQSDIEARRGNLRSDSDSVAPPLRFSNDVSHLSTMSQTLVMMFEFYSSLRGLQGPSSSTRTLPEEQQ